MAKVSLPTLISGFLAADKLNDALVALAAAIENTLSRDGTTPNQMEADLDMNGHALLNVAASNLVTEESMQDYIDERASGLLTQRTQSFTATAAQTVFTLTDFEYSPGSGNIAVYVNGLRKFTPTDYTETSATVVTFLAGLTVGDKVEVVQTDFLATVELPTHTHAWSQITGAPVYATRWPTWTEVTDKPTTFTPAAHNQDASTITTGRLTDARRGVFVQATQPVAPTLGDLWFW